MALLFADGFDHYATAQLPAKWSVVNEDWTSPTVQATIARNGTQSLLIPGSNGGNKDGGVIKNLSVNAGTLFVGFAANPKNTNNPGGFFQFEDGATNQLSFEMTAAAAIAVYRGTTLLGTSANNIIPASAFHYIEIQAVFATGATGSIIVKVDTVTVLSLTNIQTASSANAYANRVCFGQLYFSGVGSNLGLYGMYYDDIYVCDNTGTTNNTFLGDIKVVSLKPTGAGRLNQFAIGGTTPAATNWQSVSEIPPDGDVTYVSDATVGQIDDYALSPLTAASVIGVQAVAYARKDDATVRTLGLGVGNGTTENFDAGQALGTTYQFFLREMDINPITGLTWAVGDFSTLQSAIKVVS